MPNDAIHRPHASPGEHAMRDGAIAQAGPAWLREYFPGYFALVMGTGIVAVAARMLGHPAVAWPLFAISLAAYPVLWAILLARLAIFPRAIVVDFVSHERGPTFLTIVAANGVLGSQFATFDTLGGLLPLLFWFSIVLWAVLVYGFLSAVTVSIAKPGLEHGLNGSWLLLVVATESLAVLGSFLALRSGEPPALVFASLAFYLLGTMLYVLLSALIFFRWVFRPMHPVGVPSHASRRNGCAVVDQHGCRRDRDAGGRAADGIAGQQRSQPRAAAALRQPLHGAPMGHQHILDTAAGDPVRVEGNAARPARI
jgi:hypothetical protein